MCHNCLTKEMLDSLVEILRDFLVKWQCTLLEFAGEGDHVHLLFEAHPTVELPQLIKNLKSVSARRIRSEYGDYLAKYYWKPYF
ncbi:MULTISPECIES: IS200/IS605 family transposase [Moorena]|uniref:IS200/IS605 family transposase n=1 Tax=Moorena producens (strain JHB) TaxID=1454205 RepID=A0A9Q9SUC5_MOOP1|nr:MULTISPECIES: IS200/IS605 family transposase [Moorena]WAN69804.1 IS200/IS605 family transposase [Moorena producens JHB]